MDQRPEMTTGAAWSSGVGEAVASTQRGVQPPATVIDTTVAHPARRYDYWLGGKTHYAVDRESGDAVAAAFPAIRTAVLENRRFLQRAVAVLAREHGIDQFLDIGTGIPSAGNTHEIAQQITPSARVVYADNDPVVLMHARALLDSSDPGRTAYIHGDLRHPATILDDPALAATLDLSRPIALMLVAVLHFLVDQDEPHRIMRQLVDILPAGSFVVLSHATFDFMPAEELAALADRAVPSHGPFRPRSRAEVSRFLTGLQVLEPGLVAANEWRADDEPEPRPSAAETAVYAVVARKP